MKYVIITILYLVISGIIIGIATRNHDENNKDFNDMTKFEIVVAVIAALPFLVVFILMGVPMMIVYCWMHEGCRK